MSILWVVLFFLGIIISLFTGNIKNMSSIILNSTNEALKTFISMSLLIMFSIYSSIILLLIVDVLYEIAKPWSKSSLADNFGSLPLGMVSLILLMIQV